jgi:hypothetical protein
MVRTSFLKNRFKPIPHRNIPWVQEIEKSACEEERKGRKGDCFPFRFSKYYKIGCLQGSRNIFRRGDTVFDGLAISCRRAIGFVPVKARIQRNELLINCPAPAFAGVTVRRGISFRHSGESRNPGAFYFFYFETVNKQAVPFPHF